MLIVTVLVANCAALFPLQSTFRTNVHELNNISGHVMSTTIHTGMIGCPRKNRK